MLLTAKVATGTRPFTYQWRREGRILASATRESLALEDFRSADAGDYDVLVSNSAGSTISSNFVSLRTAGQPVGAAGYLANLSVLASVDDAGGNFTVGYSLSGYVPGERFPLLLRAVGPSLSQFGMSTFNPDPRMEFFADAEKVGEQDNWEGLGTVTRASAQVGAFPLVDSASKDSAALVTSTIGSHSARISGHGEDTGAVLAEIYDARSPIERGASTARLVNLSALRNLGTGFFAGFVVGGNLPLEILIRAVGPSLPNLGLHVNTLRYPRIVLYAGQSHLLTNESWGGTATLSEAFRRSGAFALPSNSRDSALLHRLFPGSYTIHVQSVDGTDGAVLLELYELPSPAAALAPASSR